MERQPEVEKQHSLGRFFSMQKYGPSSGDDDRIDLTNLALDQKEFEERKNPHAVIPMSQQAIAAPQ